MTAPSLPSDARGVTAHADGPTRPTEAPRALFTVRGDGRPTAALRRSAELAAALGHELHVVRVLRRRPVTPGVRPSRGDHAPQDTRRSEEALAATRAWLLDTLGDPKLAERLLVATGGYEATTIARAKALGARAVFIAEDGKRVGRLAATVACAVGEPVIVPRPRGGEDTIVAATTLADGLPVLDRAASLARALGERVVAVHNVVPRAASASLGPDAVVSVVERRTRRLRKAARQLASSSVLSVGVDSCRAVIDEARARGADIIVVGASPRSWVERIVASDLAADVVNASRRTVVVEPLDGAR